MAKKKKETPPDLPNAPGPPLTQGPPNSNPLQPKTGQGPFNSTLVFGDVVLSQSNGRGMVYAIVLNPAPGFLIAFETGCSLCQSPATLTYIGSIFDL